MSAAQRMLLVGTQKGLFIARADGDGWTLEGPHVAGYEIIHCCAPPREPGVLYAAASHKIWGAHIYRSEDYGRSWASLPATPQHPVDLVPGRDGRGAAVRRHRSGRPVLQRRPCRQLAPGGRAQ